MELVRRLGVIACLSLCTLATPARVSAEVKVGLSADGTRVIYNESSRQHADRLAANLVPLPDVDLAPLIERHAESSHLDSRLVRAVIQVESGYNPAALSNKGAMGLMQLTAETAHDLAVHDPYDPEENVRGGTRYLRSMLDRFSGSLELALAAYNAGPGAVESFGGIPPFAETRTYVRRILALYRGKDEPLPEVKLPAKGAKPYFTRGPDNRLLLTNLPPAEPR